MRKTSFNQGHVVNSFCYPELSLTGKAALLRLGAHGAGVTIVPGYCCGLPLGMQYVNGIQTLEYKSKAVGGSADTREIRVTKKDVLLNHDL